MIKSWLLISVALLCFAADIRAQTNDSISFLKPASVYNKKRCIAVSSLQIAGYGSSLLFLGNAWYSDYNQTSFHFFNDRGEWMQVDKTGHFLTSWYLAKTGIDLFSWSGLQNKKARVLGSMSGFLFLTGIEVLDGYSTGWGFSWTDFTANTLGAGIALGQTYLKQNNSSAFGRGIANTLFKYSFHRTNFPHLRSNLLGKTLLQQMLKDYNGQTYWLSINPSSFLKEESKFPAWLNVAFGYGAEGMLGAREGLILTDDGNAVMQHRYRQYYFSLDVDLTRINTKSYFLKTLAKVFSQIKIPAPAIEFSNNKMKLHPVYF